MPPVLDTLLEAGAGTALLKLAACHAQKPPEGTGLVRLRFGCGNRDKRVLWYYRHQSHVCRLSLV